MVFTFSICKVPDTSPIYVFSYVDQRNYNLHYKGDREMLNIYLENVARSKATYSSSDLITYHSELESQLGWYGLSNIGHKQRTVDDHSRGHTLPNPHLRLSDIKIRYRWASNLLEDPYIFRSCFELAYTM